MRLEDRMGGRPQRRKEISIRTRAFCKVYLSQDTSYPRTLKL
jgi:hypothetical protein